MTELLGHCMGVIGMSYDDFCRLTFEEIDEILKRWAEHNSERVHDGWERMRLHSFLILKPFCSRLTSPKELLPFTWDKTDEEDTDEPEIMESPEEREANLQKQMEALGWQ